MTTPIFVYGTLRSNAGLGDYYLQNAEYHALGVLPHASLHRHFGARFPVLEVHGTDRRSVRMVRGEVYLVSLSDPVTIDMIEMELGAGYEPRWLDVCVGIDRWVTCMAFAWPDHLPVGPHIPSGDWKAADAQRICNELPIGTGFATRSRR